MSAAPLACLILAGGKGTRMRSRTPKLLHEVLGRPLLGWSMAAVEELAATPTVVIVPPDATVADALARVRDEELTPALACMVYVCRPPLDTPTGRFVGAVHFQRLLREPPSTLVSGLIDTELVTLTDQANVNEVSRYFATYNLVNAPVVDADHRLIGAITVDDVLDHMLPEDWRGIELDAVSTKPPEEGAVAHG